MISLKSSSAAEIGIDFEWSASEQVWPFEKTSAGETLYCKEIAVASYPNNGFLAVAHNISGFDDTDLFSLDLVGARTATDAIDATYYDGGTYIGKRVATSNMYIHTSHDFTQMSGHFRIIYKK